MNDDTNKLKLNLREQCKENINSDKPDNRSSSNNSNTSSNGENSESQVRTDGQEGSTPGSSTHEGKSKGDCPNPNPQEVNQSKQEVEPDQDSLTPSLLQYKINKLYPKKCQKALRVSLRKVQTVQFDAHSNRGEMKIIGDLGGLSVMFHRNDFKNRSWLLKPLIITGLTLTVLIIDDFISTPKLLYLPQNVLGEQKDGLYKFGVTKADIRAINIHEWLSKNDK